jgi:hypothetical protein
MTPGILLAGFIALAQATGVMPAEATPSESEIV